MRTQIPWNEIIIYVMVLVIFIVALCIVVEGQP
jgi:hypothetical protein